MKKILTVVLFLGLLSTSMLLTSCKDSILDPTTQANPNLFSYSITLSEYTMPDNQNAFDALNGVIVGDFARARDIEMPDSLSLGERFFLRSGDGSPVDDAGYETKFTTGWNISETQFDNLETFYTQTGSLSPVDFTSHVTSTFGENFANTTYRAYGFYLKEKFETSVTTNPVYGILYIQSAVRESGSLKVTLKVKINKAGLNDFRNTIPLS